MVALLFKEKALTVVEGPVPCQEDGDFFVSVALFYPTNYRHGGDFFLQHVPHSDLMPLPVQAFVKSQMKARKPPAQGYCCPTLSAVQPSTLRPGAFTARWMRV